MSKIISIIFLLVLVICSAASKKLGSKALKRESCQYVQCECLDEQGNPMECQKQFCCNFANKQEWCQYRAAEKSGWSEGSYCMAKK